MIIRKLAIPRRTFLRGAGATVALPLLDAMVPALSALSTTAAAPVRRLGFVYIPNGAVMQQWTPAETGSGFALSPILQPLAPYKDQLTVVTGLAHGQAEPLGDGNRTWTGHATPLAGVGHRSGRARRQLRERLQLCVLEYGRLALGHHAAADGEQPAGRVRAALW